MNHHLQPSSGLPSVPPAQVWAGLAPELRERVVHLLAHLACTLATTPLAPAKESAHVVVSESR